MNVVSIKAIKAALGLRDVCDQIPGGFPQFSYRSCLKGKPLDFTGSE